MPRLSLRELLVLVGLTAIAIASLKYASDAWLAIVITITMVVFFIAAIEAVVDRETRQAAAIGIALTMGLYTLLVMSSPLISTTKGRNIEFVPWEGRLPTTRLLGYLRQAVDASYYHNLLTGQRIADYDPAKDGPFVTGEGGFGGGGFGGGAAINVAFTQLPKTELFMPIGHCWWALLLGYAGGHFARFVYLRRMPETADA